MHCGEDEVKLNTIIISLLLCFSLLHTNAYAGNWTKEDTFYQAASTVLQVADWGQARYISEHPEKYYEINPILGEHPSIEEVNIYFAGSIIGKTLISYLLPPKLRRIWQVGNIGASTYLVIRNNGIGIKIKF